MIIRRASLTPFDFGGLQIFDYTAGLESSSSLAVIEVPPGATHTEAWSKRSDKYYLVTSGTIRFVLEGVECDLAAGDVCLVRQGQRFRYANRNETQATLVLVHTPSFNLDSEVLIAGEKQ